ncbi:MAG: hypothetical protein CMH61_00910 [Nanoarchaeota archaeon]|nr:hypothetical protein [Nanoarchaeota archaeon]
MKCEKQSRNSLLIIIFEVSLKLFYGIELPQSFGQYVSASPRIDRNLNTTFRTKFGDKKAIMFTVIFPPITVLIATLLNKWLAVFFMLLSPLFFGLRTPILDHLIHKEVTSSMRATVYSVAELIKKLALAIFAPFAGYLAELYSINVAFQMTGIILFIVPILYFFLKEK